MRADEEEGVGSGGASGGRARGPRGSRRRTHLLGGDVTRVFHAAVALRVDGPLAEGGVVVKVELGVDGDDAACVGRGGAWPDARGGCK